MNLQSGFTLIFLFCASFSWAKVKNKVSLQWAICDDDPQVVLEKLGEVVGEPDKLDPISYYDTNPPFYTPRGLMFRTKVRGGRDISMIKVRVGKETSNLPRSGICLWDRYGDLVGFACKMQSPINNKTSIWSDDQVHFAHHFWSSIDWDELVEFGPYPNPKWKQLKIRGYKSVLDDVAVPSHHLMELEVKVPKHRGEVAYQTITEYLRNAGVVLCGQQESKTIRLFRAMGYFSNDAVSSVDVPFHNAQRPLAQN